MGNINNSNLVSPSLWVEKVWILKSLDAIEPLQEITLSRGLNLIVSPPTENSVGHGVGKSAFCQLIRFILDDPLWSSGSGIWDELRENKELKGGAVAAKVYIGQEVWTVLKPWQHQNMYRASQDGDWRQLALNQVDNDYLAYQQSLHQHFVDTLPIKELPGSAQPIKWHHILAWLSRDQNARYLNYFEWRPEGVGFNLPSQSPFALIKIVLGILQDATTLRNLEKVNKQLEDLKFKLQKTREEPEFLLSHIRQTLNQKLYVDNVVPFRSHDLFEEKNIIGLANQRKKAYQNELEAIKHKLEELSAETENCLSERAPLLRNINLLKNLTQQEEAVLASDFEALEKLKNEADSLQQQLNNRCELGGVLLKDCSHVQQRIEQIPLDRYQRMKMYEKSENELKAKIELYKERLKYLEQDCLLFDHKLEGLKAQREEQERRQLETLASLYALSEALDHHEFYEKVIKGKVDWKNAIELEKKIDKTSSDKEKLKVRLKQENEAYSQRRNELSEQINLIVKSLPDFKWGVFNDNEKQQKHPFRIGPKSSAAFKVLEILVGDIACLLDAAKNKSNHPKFLLHDSPREAELNEHLLWRLLEFVSSQNTDAFQYIVTTSTLPPQALEPYVRLKLAADSANNYLFKTALSTPQQDLI